MWNVQLAIHMYYDLLFIPFEYYMTFMMQLDYPI